MQTNYPGLNVVGPGNGSVIPALTQVGLADGSKFNFTYNTWGQVYRIGRSTPRSDNPSLYRERTYVSYNLPLNAAGSQGDCPRFTERREWAENWNGDSDSVPVAGEEALTTFSPHSFAGGVTTVTVPDGTQYKEFFVGTSPAWQRGITTQTETWSGGVRRKWTIVSWTQDNTGLAYQKNPRVTETNIHDETENRKRTTIDYGAYVTYGLPYLITEYGIGGAGIMRQTYIDYNLNSAYVSRRIIGLVSSQQVSNGSAVQSKTLYAYDTGTLASTSSIQHDAAYNTGFVTGRGNVSTVSRYDVTDINNATKALTTTVGYNVDGSVVFSRDPLSHQNNLSYTDSFADGIARNTFAYPTTGTDAGGYTSTSKYSFDTGSVTQQQTPQPNTTVNQPGPIQTFAYDSIGRIQRVTTLTNGAFTEFVYPQDLMMVQSFTTIRDDSIGNPSLRAYSAKVFDGAGRLMGTIASHPGSVGGYTAQDTNYDVMGRLFSQSNPTETSGNWVPSGDDAAGWFYRTQLYDWNSRPTISTNTDATQSINSYGGCGCAGGEVATSGDASGRQKRIYSDVLGRAWKTEVLNFDSTVYATSVSSYNGRDQIVSTKDYQGQATGDGSCPAGTCQEITMTYDGYGRLASKHVPEQAAGTNTTYTYKTDDTLWTVTDSRGASVLYNYNSRKLMTSINHSAPSPIVVPAAASFTYDAAGNRISMTDGPGTVVYQYDQLSRLSSESRSLNDLPNAPVPNNDYTIAYGYNLGGKVTSITDPFGSQISYTHDAAGRLNSITRPASPGAPGIPNTMSNIQYRAFGKLKQGTIGWNGNTSTILYTHDAKMEVNRFQVSSATAGTHGAQYQRYNDGRVSYVQDLSDPEFDRLYSYDLMGRVTQGLTGAEARNSAPANGPYKQMYSYDAFSNLTSRTGRHWTKDVPTQTNTFANNRNTQWTYDADGRVTQAGTQQFRYDAAGQSVNPTGSVVVVYDGDGQRVKQYSAYELRSSVLGGQVLTQVGPDGNKQISYAYANGKPIGREGFWEVASPINSGAFIVHAGSLITRDKEFSPIGDNVGVENPYLFGGGGDGSGGYPSYGDPSSFRCAIDGTEINCSSLSKFYLSKNSLWVLTMTIRERIGVAVNQTKAQLVPGKDHAGDVKLRENTMDPARASSVEIIAEPDQFKVTNVGTVMSWVEMRTLEYRSLQNRGFLIGRFGFSASEAGRLARAFDQITSDECRKFFDETLARMRKNAEIHSQYNSTPSTLAGVMAITTLNKYSSNLTAAAVGVSQRHWNNVRNNIENPGWFKRVNGVTLEGDGRVFLTDHAFYQPNAFTQMYRAQTDLPGVIIHEFFHRAGLNHEQVEALNKEIQKNCGTPGFGL